MQSGSAVQTQLKGALKMAAKLKRMTFAVAPDMEVLLDSAKKEMFCDRTQSDMIRELIAAGLRASKPGRAAKRNERKRCA